MYTLMAYNSKSLEGFQGSIDFKNYLYALLPCLRFPKKPATVSGLHLDKQNPQLRYFLRLTGSLKHHLIQDIGTLRIE